MVEGFHTLPGLKAREMEMSTVRQRLSFELYNLEHTDNNASDYNSNLNVLKSSSN